MRKEWLAFVVLSLAAACAGAGCGSSGGNPGGPPGGGSSGSSSGSASGSSGSSSGGRSSSGSGSSSGGSSSSSGGSPDAGPDAGPIDDGPVPDGSNVDLATSLTIADVAILFPLSDNLLAPDTTGDQGALLPGAVAPTLQLGASPSPLRVTAMRLDPCFASLSPPPDGSGCVNQMRLVFQPFDALETSDDGVHVFYSLTREQFVAALKSLVALRLAQAPGEHLGGLAPHAVMIRQGPTGAMTRGVRAIIKKYAGAQNLTRVTRFNDVNGNFFWDFAGNDVDPSGKETPMPIPTLTVTGAPPGSAAIDQTFNGTTPSPETSSPSDPVPLIGATSPTAPGIPAAIDGVFQIENPTMHSPNTIDCLSCHLTGVVRGRLAGSAITFTSNTYAYASKHVPAADMVPSVTGSVNLHAFSYFVNEPGISQRTVNEAAAIVDYVIDNVK